MRISRFCEARGWYEADNSIESKIFCFGEDGPSGDAADVESGKQGRGPAASGPQKSLGAKSDVADFSRDDSDRRVQSTGSTTNFNIDRSQPSVSTESGRVYGTQENLDRAIASGDLDITPSAIDSYTPGTPEAESAFTSAGGIMSRESSSLAGTVPEFDEPAGAVNLEDALGYNPFTPTAVTQTAKGPALGTTDYEFDALGGASRAAAPGPTTLSPEQDARLSAMLAAEGVPLPGPTTAAQAEGRQQARDAFEAGQLSRGATSAVGDLDIFGDVDPVDLMGPVDLDEQPAGALDLAKAGATRAGSPMQQITEMAARPGYTPSTPSQRKGSNALLEEPMPSGVPREMGRVESETVLGGQNVPPSGSVTDPATSFAAASNLGLADSRTMAAMEDEVAQGLGSLAAAQEPSNFNFSRDVLGVDQNIPQMSLAPESRASQFDRQARMGEVQGPMSMAPVDATRFSGVDMMRQADDVLGQRAIDEAIFGDTSDMPPSLLRVGAEVINSLESTFGGNQARKIADVANRPGGALVRDPASGEILGAVGPEENIRSAFMGAQDAVYVGDPRGYQMGVEIGSSILGPNTTVRDVPTTDPFTGELEARPGADYSSGSTDTGGGDGGGQPIIPPAQEVVSEPVHEEYQGQAIPGGRAYQPMGPISYAYTGLPSLAPQRLQPSFQARGQYAPLYPMRRRA